MEDSEATAPSVPAPRWLVTAGAYLGLALFMTFPLVLHFTSALPAGGADLWQNYWNFWWWKKALLELHQSPFFASYLYYPSGGAAALHTHSPFNMLVALPVTVLLGPAAAYNFCLLLALTLSGLGAYALVLDLTRDRRSAFLGGLVFAFFPNTLDHTREHLNHFSTQFVAWSLFFYLRLRREGRARDAVALGVCFALNALADWHLGIALAILLASLSLFEIARRAWRFVAPLALAGLVATALALPALLPLAANLEVETGLKNLGRADFGIDPGFLLLPPPENPLLGRFAASTYAARQRYDNAGFVCYLPVTALALGALALVRRRREALPWLVLFASALVLSVGAQLYWLGRPVTDRFLPFAAIERVPLLNLAREANHFMVLVALGLAGLAGLGLRSVRRGGRAVFAAAVVLLLAECLVLPYRLRETRVSDYYARIASGGLPGAVLDIPFSADGRIVENMRYQVSHGRPIAGGYLSITPDRALSMLRRDPFLQPLSGLSPRFKVLPALEDFQKRGFGYVIVHKDRVAAGGHAPDRRKFGDFVPLATYQTLRSGLDHAFGSASFEDETLVVFEVPGATLVLPTAERTPKAAPREPRTPAPARQPSPDRS